VPPTTINRVVLTQTDKYNHTGLRTTVSIKHLYFFATVSKYVIAKCAWQQAKRAWQKAKRAWQQQQMLVV